MQKASILRWFFALILDVYFTHFSLLRLGSCPHEPPLSIKTYWFDR